MSAVQSSKPVHQNARQVKVVITPAATDFDAERAATDTRTNNQALDVLLDANFEIAEMSLELAKRADDNSDPVSRGMAMRIYNLNLLVHYLMTEEKQQHALDLGRTVYGPGFRLGGEKS